MPNIQGASLEEQVKKLLEQNLAYSREIYVLTKKVKNYLMWGRIMSIVSLVLFVILPLILSAVYLPSLIKNGMNSLINPAGLLNSSNSDGAGDLPGLLKNGNVRQEDLLKAVEEQGGPINAYKNILQLYQNQ